MTKIIAHDEPYRLAQDPPTIALDAIQWRDSSENGDKSRLLGTIRLGDVDLHVEAYESTIDDEGVQQFRGSYGESADEVYAAIGCSGAWYTATIEGREYVLIATPFCT